LWGGGGGGLWFGVPEENHRPASDN
jgi:hypothetical protein